MSQSTEPGGKSFSELELAGWERAADSYDEMAGSITRQSAPSLLDATGVGHDARVLEVCCGPGYAAAEAAARGARARGLDFSPGMVAQARERVPQARFDVGDAAALPYDDGCFDAVVCAFGLLHLPDPEASLAEAYRVLAPGGRYGFTVWCTPDKVEFFSVVYAALEAHGDVDVPLPDAPPMFRFADPAETERVLKAAGFVEPAFRELPLSFQADRPGDVLELTYRSAVRARMMLELQPEERRERIHEAILAGAERYATGDGIALAMPALMGWARKP